MKHKFISYEIVLILSVLSLLLSCKYDTQIAQPAKYTDVYMPQALRNPVQYAVTDTTHTLIYGAYYGGPDFPRTDIKVEFGIDSTLVELFNLRNNTHYRVAPQDLYSMKTTEAVILKGKVSTKPLQVIINTKFASQPGSKYLLPIEILSVNGVKINTSLNVTYYILSF